MKCLTNQTYSTSLFIKTTSEAYTYYKFVDWFNKLPIAQIKEKWDHLRDIELPELSSSRKVGVLTGAGMPQLHLQHDIRIGNFNAAVAVKATLGWVLIHEKRSNSVNTSIVSTNKLNINYDDDLNKQVEKFWSVEFYGTMKPYDKENMTKEEK